MKFSISNILKKLIFSFSLTITIFTGTTQATETWELSYSAVADINPGMNTGLISGGVPLWSNFIFSSDEVDNPEFITNFHPFPVTQKIINSAYCMIISRTGSYTSGTLILTLDVRNLSGIFKRKVSVSNIDLQAVALQTFFPIKLSPSLLIRKVLPGEYLAVHVSRTSSRGGDLSMGLTCQATVQ